MTAAHSTASTGGRHIPTRVFKQAVHLTRQAKQIEGVLSSINPLNAGKKWDEATALLVRWFPDMEDFETMVRKCQKTIDSLTERNRDLAEKAAEARNGKIKTELEIGTLQSNLRQLQRFVDSIPDDMKRQIRQIQHEKYRDERLK